MSDIPAISVSGLGLLPVLGQGTWHMGENLSHRAAEVDSLIYGIELGMTLIDTAEMYGDGASERLVGSAIRTTDRPALLVSKLLPKNANVEGIRTACNRSLMNLGVDCLDLYLLHWREVDTRLDEVVDSFEELKRAGKLRAWGVSNFDVHDMEELLAVPGGEHVAVNQVLYNLNARGVEFDLLPWCNAHGIAVMAYSPLDEGRLIKHTGLAAIARDRGVSAAELALAFLVDKPGVIAIPKAGSRGHMRSNRGCADMVLSSEDHLALNSLFPSPRSKVALAMI